MDNRQIRLSTQTILGEIKFDVKRGVSKQGLLRKINQIMKRVIKNFPVKEDKELKSEVGK